MKRDANGIARRYMERTVVCGIKGNEELTNSFAHVVDFSIAHMLLSITDHKAGKNIGDYISAFFHGTLNCEVYMTMPELMNEGCIGKVRKLKMRLYRPKESSRFGKNCCQKVSKTWV